MKEDQRGKHGSCGRKPKADPRNKNVNIRLNSKEHANLIECQNVSGMSQADLICYFVNRFIKEMSK